MEDGREVPSYAGDGIVCTRREEFQHLSYKGTFAKLRGFFEEEKEVPIECNIFYEFRHATGANRIFERVTHMKTNKGRYPFLKSVRKCDKPLIKPEGGWRAALYDVALAYTDRMYEYMYGSAPATAITFNTVTSAGVPYNLKYKSKGDMLKNGREEFKEAMIRSEWALFKTNSKDEFLPIEDVMEENKLRTYFSQNVADLGRQKVFTTDQNERMKARSDPKYWPIHWSRYGFVKQYGGFNDLYAMHAQFLYHKTRDISGYDRTQPFMMDIWDMRERWMKCQVRGGPPAVWPDSFQAAFDQVRLEVCRPWIFLPDGSVYERQCGNPSGSDTTTTDNTIGHTIGEFYSILCYRYEMDEHVLSYEEILEHTAISLYGDDELGSCNLPELFGPYATMEGWRDSDIESFASLGMVVKEKAVEWREGEPKGLEFLGSRSMLVDGYYLPLPRLGKLCTSVVFCVHGKQKTAQQLFSTIMAINDLVGDIPDADCREVWTELREFATFVLRHTIMDDLPEGMREYLTRVASGDLALVRSTRLGWEAHL